jgi:lipopolysaccharide exporter
MKSLAQSVISSSSMLGGLKIVEKSLGLISTIILARILTPEDFGIVAIAMIFIYFFESIGDSGGGQYLIQKKNIDSVDINSAFTLNIIIKGGLFLFLIILIPYISDFYENPDLVNVLYFSSFMILIRALTNPGQILLKKSLEFSLIAKVALYTKLVTFISVLTLAYFLQSYWALLITDVLNVALLVIASYFIHPYRPGISTKKIREQFSFSQWILLRSIVGFFRGQVDRILISKLFGPSLIGEYHIARHVASLPSQEIILPATEPLLSSFSKANDTPDGINYQLNLSLLIVACLVAPISSFFYFHSEVLVLVLLGSQWENSAAILSGLAPLVTTTVLGSILGQACISKNKPSLLFIYDLFSFTIIISILLMFSDLYIGDFALLRSIIDIGLFTMFYLYVSRLLSFNPLRPLSEVFTVILFSAAAGYFTAYAQPDDLNILLKLILSSLIFAFSYLSLLLTFHYAFYKRTDKGMHIHYLVGQGLETIYKRFLKK